MTKAEKKAATYAPTQTLTEFAENVLSDELFCSARPGTDRVAAWVPDRDVGTYKGMRHSPYKYVEPDDVEELSGGATRPAEKDFGVFVKVLDGQNRVTLGSPPHYLMWTFREARELRQRELTRQAGSLAPKPRGRSGEETESVNEQFMTLDELRGKG